MVQYLCLTTRWEQKLRQLFAGQKAPNWLLSSYRGQKIMFWLKQSVETINSFKPKFGKAQIQIILKALTKSNALEFDGFEDFFQS